jgi:hypothetical protein
MAKTRIANNKVATSTVTLGSGDLYIMDFSGSIPADTEIEKADNKIGSIKGGAELEYKPESYTVTGDNGRTYKAFITKEEVTFKSGVLTWNLEVLSKLTMGGELTTGVRDEDVNVKILNIGKNGSSSIKQVLIRFVHNLGGDKKVRVTLVGSPTSGFTLSFNPEEETVIDAEFTAISQEDGTLVKIETPEDM